MIVGTGNVGSSIAYAMLNQRTPVKELILTDVNAEDAEGEVMDLQDALTVAPSWLKIRTGTYQDAKTCDLCILTAGISQRPGDTRLDLLRQNAKITKSIVTEIMAAGFSGVFLVISNPVDILSYLVWQTSGLPAERVIGSGTVLDSARLRFAIADRLHIHPKSIHAYEVGEHGDSEFALWSSANVAGEKLERFFSPDERQHIETAVKNQAYNIIAKKGATHFGIGTCAVQIVNCILNDERRVLSVSSLDYATGIYNGFPTILGRNGVDHRLSPRLSEEEAIRFQRSVNVLKNNLKKLKLNA